jgi:4'-phosphopantetheinyl transferase
MQLIYRRVDEPGPMRMPAGDEIHIWIADLDGDHGTTERSLTERERERAGKYRMERVRRQYITARGLLRQLLGAYLNIPGIRVPIDYEDTGKPFVVGRPLSFNLSHSENLAAFAFTASGRLGVDIEVERTVANADALVERFFTEPELQAYQGLEADLRPRAFLKMWTRKEALLKAMGQGIHALDACEITVHPDEPARVLCLPEAGDCTAWTLADWQPQTGFLGAIAYERG